MPAITPHVSDDARLLQEALETALGLQAYGVDQDFVQRIHDLVGDIEVDLDAPLLPEDE